MSAGTPSSGPEPAPAQKAILRRLFLTLFLRGRGARGLRRQDAPKSVGQKLALTLLFYLAFGCMALLMTGQPVFALGVYLHAMTFVFLGMFVASSSGEILFNKEEADILLHRPVDGRTLLWAKIRVLVEVSLWLAFAFNLAGLFAGIAKGGWRFPLAHIASTTLEALFCTGSVVLLYQLCLRWFGRERLEGLMTMAQVVVSVGAVLSGQILPRVVLRYDHVLTASESSWWIGLLPPAWFAGFDDAFAGTAMLYSWILAALAVGLTAAVLWAAFGRLADNYTSGLQALNETVSTRAKKDRGGRWLNRLVQAPPFSWWLRDPVTRASFLLTAAYLFRDRDVKLRVYPGIAPVLIMPFVFLLQGGRHQHGGMEGGFGIPFSGVYLGMGPLMGLQLLQYSQQWQAADVFRAAPLAGPAALCDGARRAVLWLLALPMLVLMGLIVWALCGDAHQLLLFLPGMIALPVFALMPGAGGHGVPLSMPTDASRSAGRGLVVILAMIPAVVLALLASWSWSAGWFWWLVLGETIVAIAVYAVMRWFMRNAPWPAETA